MIDKYFVDGQFEINNNIPSTYGRGMSYFEEITKLITYVNSLYEQYVAHGVLTTELTTQYTNVLLELNTMQQQFTDYANGKTIPDGSITLSKLSVDFLQHLDSLVIDTVHNVAKFVSFGLSDDGHFIANVPESWTEITFSTSLDGELILNY